MRAALIALVLAATPAMAEPTAAEYVAKLVPALARSIDAATVIGTPPAGITAAQDTGRWTLTVPQTDTKTILAAWKWKTMFAVSGDVHQRQFSIYRKTQALSKDRIATVMPNAGRWSIDVTLVARPEGKMPGLVAGASPAYDLPRYASKVAQIEISERDVDELEMVLKDIAKPTMADVERELGPPDADVGSGIHVLQYKLGGKKIHVGSPDNKSVMYIRIDDRDVYRMKPT